MDIQPNFEAVKKTGVSRSEVWKLRCVCNFSVVPLSVTG